jgi:hypothetical protein
VFSNWWLICFPSGVVSVIAASDLPNSRPITVPSMITSPVDHQIDQRELRGAMITRPPFLM